VVAGFAKYSVTVLATRAAVVEIAVELTTVIVVAREGLRTLVLLDWNTYMPVVSRAVLVVTYVVLPAVAVKLIDGVAPEVFAPRETYRRLPYDRKFAPENQVSALKFVGLAKRKAS
jgi:hypothetical protein